MRVSLLRFLSRYCLPLFIILFLAAFVSGVHFKNILLYLLLIALGVFVVMVVMVSYEKYRWICRECGHESFFAGKCTRCGGLTEFRKITHLYKICENGHRMRDKYNQYKFCPKCGKPLREQVISETEKELSSKVS